MATIPQTKRMASPSGSDSLSSQQQADRAETLSAFQGVISNEDAEKQTERLISLYKTARTKNHKICLLHDDRKWQHAANDVYVWYKQKNVPCHMMSYCDEDWFTTLQQLKATHFLFFGLPPYDRGKKVFGLKRSARSPSDNSPLETDYFTPGSVTHKTLRLNSIVVVLPEKIATRKEYRQKVVGHYLDRYLKLDGQKMPSVLAASALGVFAAPQPKPLESDNAFWSAQPKLVEDFRVSYKVSLGLTIMTRDMAEGAPFTKIVLINSISSDFRYEFYSRVGRYTHIQSINGILLDGLDIEKVTDVFKKLPDHHVQMLVRYIHMGEKDVHKDAGSHHSSTSSHQSPLRELPQRQSTFSVVSSMADTPGSNQQQTSLSQQKTSRSSVVESSILPLPLFILGDNYLLCKQLYNALLTEDGPLTTPDIKGVSNGSAPNTPTYIHQKGPHPSNKEPLPTNRRQTPIRSVSLPQGPTTIQQHKLIATMSSRDVSETLREYDEIEDTLTPLVPRPALNEVPQPPGTSDTDIKQVRRRTNSFKGISSSDKFILRSEMPMNRFEKIPDLQEPSEMEILTVTSPISPGSPPRQPNAENLPQHQFILHLPDPKLDRSMTHLYFKPSGIYIVVVGLEDLIHNPLCQYENLFYWINLIHTYVSPEVKRVLVVGLYNRSTVTQQYVIESVKILNKILDKYRQTVRIPVEEQGYIYLFNLENKEAECQYLCSCILNCTRLFAKSSYYFAQEFHNYVFSPFREFQRIASEIGLNNDRAIMEYKFAMGQRFYALFEHQQNSHLPPGYYETLACYSTACISRHCDGCLLIPSVIPDLLNHCAGLSNFDTQIFDDPHLRNLPLFSIHMLRHAFQQLHPNNTKDFEMIVWWMEQLSIIYSVGKGKQHGDERFFVPFLLQYHLSDRPMYEWDEEKVEDLFKDATILYTQFSTHVPMTIHLFHKILAYILKSVLKEGAQSECYINPDSPEVVLPLHDDNNNDEFVCSVFVRYLAVQNIVEFRANVSNRMKFLHVVENKLSKAFLGSKYYNKTIDVNRVVSFCVPAEHLTRDTTHHNVWDLGQLESSQDNIEDHLVATSHLTEPGNRSSTAPLRQWADTAPEMKDLPPELANKIGQRLNLADNWVHVVVALKLMNNEEILLRRQQHNADNGAEALLKWRDSSRTLRELATCLRNLHLDNLADEVEAFQSGGVDLVNSVTNSSKIMEKKLPTDIFMDLSRALNQDDKWALLGSYLNLLKVTEIENFRSNSLVVDKGGHVLQRWTDSHLTYQDLINALEMPKVGLKIYVRQIEDIIKNHYAQL